MLGLIFVIIAFIFFAVAGLVRPWIGMVGFYFFVFLCPEWNWRWAVSQDFGFQKWIFLTATIGFMLSGFSGNAIRGCIRVACLGLSAFLVLAYISAQSTIDEKLTAFYMSSMWKIVAAALLAVKLLDSPTKIQITLWAITLGHGYNALAITREYLSYGYCRYVYHSRWAWTGSNQIANLAVCAAAISLALVFFSKQLWQKMLAGMIFLLQVHEVMLLESRGCMLGLVGVVLIGVWLMPRSKTNYMAVGFSAIAVLLLAGPSVVQEFSSIFNAGEKQDDSAASRTKLWKAGAKITMDYPLLGVGPYAGQKLVPKYYDGGLDRERKGLHNLIFEISTGCGVPATLGFLSFFCIPGYQSFRILRRAGPKEEFPLEFLPLYVCSVGLVGFFIANMFSAGGLMEGSYSLAVAGCAGVLQIAKPRHSFETQQSSSEWLDSENYSY